MWGLTLSRTRQIRFVSAGTSEDIRYARAVSGFRVIEVAAARPNFMKIAPLHRELALSDFVEPILVHAGQHYDPSMSDVFFADLGLPEPDIRLDIGSGSHAEQTARVLTRLEPYLISLKPAATVVVGDVNSTLAAALCAAKLNIPVVHVEAGLRSRNRAMPEEVNRVATDAIADLLLAPSEDAVKNLRREGHSDEDIKMVGNVMIDSLESIMPKIQSSIILNEQGLEPQGYLLVTLHRPSNVDDERRLVRLVDIFTEVGRWQTVVFVAHPRTRNLLDAAGVVRDLKEAGVRLLEPLGYIDFLALEASSAAVLTDSGGVQEETTVLGVPCLTLRDETERPITVTHGTNQVVGQDRELIMSALASLSAAERVPRRPPLWDGRAAGRIARLIEGRYA